MEHRCTWGGGAVEWAWDAVAFGGRGGRMGMGRRCVWEAAEDGAALRARRRIDRMLRRFWGAPKGTKQVRRQKTSLRVGATKQTGLFAAFGAPLVKC